MTAHMETDRDETASRAALRRLLLACGVLSSLLYVATDVAAAMRWNGYSYAAQFISELMSVEAPTRPFVVRLFFAYGVLVTAFGFGVVMSAGANRRLRIAGALIVGYATVGYIGLLFFPMHLRGALPALTATDVVHMILAGVILVLTFAFVDLGARATGAPFRRYSIGTIVVLLISGVLIAREAPRLGARMPTPWLGIEERVTAYASVLWLLALAVALFRRAPARAHLLRWRRA